MAPPPRRVAPLLALALAASPGASHAYTQWTAALTLGGGARLLPVERREAVVSAGLRADALFGPRDPFHVRAGPFASVATDDFDNLVAAAGVSVLLPTSTETPFVLSVGGVVDLTAQGLPLGTTGRVWWGSRSLNYHARYGMAVGLWVEARAFPASGAVDVIAGLDGDLGFLSMPVALLWNWLTH